MKPTRRTQPFRGKRGLGPVAAMMRAGRPQGLPNPMDVQRHAMKARRRRRGKLL